MAAVELLQLFAPHSVLGIDTAITFEVTWDASVFFSTMWILETHIAVVVSMPF